MEVSQMQKMKLQRCSQSSDVCLSLSVCRSLSLSWSAMLFFLHSPDAFSTSVFILFQSPLSCSTSSHRRGSSVLHPHQPVTSSSSCSSRQDKVTALNLPSPSLPAYLPIRPNARVRPVRRVFLRQHHDTQDTQTGLAPYSPTDTPTLHAAAA